MYHFEGEYESAFAWHMVRVSRCSGTSRERGQETTPPSSRRTQSTLFTRLRALHCAARRKRPPPEPEAALTATLYARTASVRTKRDPTDPAHGVSSTECGALDSVCAIVDFDGKIMRQDTDPPASTFDPSYEETLHRGSIQYLSWRHGGLLVSTLSAGGLNTCLKRALFPLLKAELNLASNQVDAATVLMLLPWSYTFVGGFVSDAFPIWGSYRKAYIILGWIITLVASFAIAILNYTLEFEALVSHAALEEARRKRAALTDWYIGLLVLASFGCVLTLVISETYVVAQTRREPLARRGHALGTLLVTQFVGELIGQIASDTTIFHIAQLGIVPLVSFRETAMFLMFYSLVPLVALTLFFHEDPIPPAINDDETWDQHSYIVRRAGQGPTQWKARVRVNWVRLRTALAQTATINALRFVMIFAFLSEFTLTYPQTQLESWCNFRDKARSTSNITLQVVYVLSIATWKYCALNWHWRYCVLVTFLGLMIGPQYVYYLLATLVPRLRNQATYSFITALRGFMRTIVVVFPAAMSAEIAPVGGEGAFLGLMVAMGTVMRLLSTTCSNALGYAFGNPSLSETEQDVAQVTIGLSLCYVIKVTSLVALRFLPSQKQELQHVHRCGASGQARTTWWVLGSLGGACCISLGFNMMAVFPATACLHIVGGAGCEK